MEERDLAILQHIGLYTLSVPRVIRDIFFDGSGERYSPVMQRLRDRGLVKSFKVLANNQSYHRLTARGGAAIGFRVTDDRERKDRQWLLTRLGILWFCTMNKRKRVYFPANDALAPLFDGFVPKGIHCIEMEETQRTFRIYVPMPDTRMRNLFKELQEQVDDAVQNSHVAEMVENHQYGFAVVVTTETRKTAIESFIKGHIHRRRRRPPLASRAYFRVECMPDFEKAAPRAPAKEAGEPQLLGDSDG